VRDDAFVWSPSGAVSAEAPRPRLEEPAEQRTRSRFKLRELWFAGLLIAILAITPAASVQAAAWSERLEPVPWIALLAVIVGLVIARSPIANTRGLLLGIGTGLVLITLQYASFQPGDELPKRLVSFVVRLTDWFGAAFSGAASTDNLLFAYTMGLLAWLIGFLGSWFALRMLSPWWAIIPGGGALLLNLSYAQPDLLWLVMVQLVTSFLLLIALNSLRNIARWRSDDVDYGFMEGTRFAATGAVLAAAIKYCTIVFASSSVSRKFGIRTFSHGRMWPGFFKN